MEKTFSQFSWSLMLWQIFLVVILLVVIVALYRIFKLIRKRLE